MARHDLDPAERDLVPLTVEQVVECPNCHVEFDVVFQCPEGVYEIEDLTDPPEQIIECPGCQVEFTALYEGWVIHEDAG